MTNEQEFMTQVDRVFTRRRAMRLTILGALLAVLGVVLIFQPEIPWIAAFPMVMAGLIAVLFFGVQARQLKPDEQAQH